MNARFHVGLCLCFGLALSSACSTERNQHRPPQRTEQTAPAAAGGVGHETLPATKPVEGASLYDLQMNLVDARGRHIGLDVFRGNPVVISMFYASCPYACPTLISDIKRLDSSLDATSRSNLRVLLVSFDAQRDTPAKLAEVAAAHHVDPARWVFASASDSQARELSAVLGIKYRRLENGAFNHSSVITLLDRRGVAVAHVDGLNQPTDELGSAIRRLGGRT